MTGPSGLPSAAALPLSGLPTAATASGEPGEASMRGLVLAVKRGVDLAFALAGLPVLLVLAVAIATCNLAGNRGPLFFTQTRMGKDGAPFTILKFRTMRPGRPGRMRGPDDPLERDRTTPFGAFLRRTRLDEAPQMINILAGEMSLVGPRPDMWEHALAYSAAIPGYARRLAVRPGLTGLAQVRVGYAEGIEATRQKVEVDLAYVRDLSLGLEAAIVRRTVGVMLTGFGAR